MFETKVTNGTQQLGLQQEISEQRGHNESSKKIVSNDCLDLPESSRMDARKVFLVLIALAVNCRCCGGNSPVSRCRRCGTIGDNVVFILVVDKFLVIVRAHVGLLVRRRRN